MWSSPSFFPRVTEWAKALARKTDYQFKPSHIFTLVGILAVGHLVERTADFLLFHLPPPSRGALQAYKRRGPKPTYALVTGASAGIGFGIAKALVQQGFGVILLGHKADELAQAASELRAALVLDEDNGNDNDDSTSSKTTPPPPVDEYVKTIVLDAMTATPEALEAALRTTIVDAGLRVSILVNNVGSLPIAHPPFRPQATYTAADIDDTIALNARFPTRLTTLLLPVLTHRGAGTDQRGAAFGTHRRSLILNVSSVAMAGLPYIVLYGATKAFNWSFSRGLARELAVAPATRHVDVLGVLPGDTRSQGNSLAAVSWRVPDAERFGRGVVGKAARAVARGWLEFYPFWWHHVEAVLQGVISERTFLEESRKFMVGMKARYPGDGAPKDD